jgi:hypothetical protein
MSDEFSMVAEIWRPTVELRWEWRYVAVFSHIPTRQECEKFLQQKWVNERGDEQWRDVPARYPWVLGDPD